MTGGLETFAKVRALHDRTTNPGVAFVAPCGALRLAAPSQGAAERKEVHAPPQEGVEGEGQEAMPRQTIEEWMRLELPYGRWTCLDGREVLFNRWYQPIWQKMPGEAARPVDPQERIAFEREQWFYTDVTPPWRSKVGLTAAEAALAAWALPIPSKATERTKPAGTRGLFRG